MYTPAKEFIDSFKEGEIIKPLEFAKSFTPEMSEDDKARQLCLLYEIILERRFLRFSAFKYYVPLTSEVDFIKKANEDYNKVRGNSTTYTYYKYYIDRWLLRVPDNCFFSEYDIVNYIPGPKPAYSTVRNYLNKAVSEHKLFRYIIDQGRYYYKDSSVAEKIPAVEKVHYNEIQQLFIDFLKERKKFDKFKEYLGKTSKFKDSKDPIKDVLTANLHPVNWTRQTFTWGKTTEGFDFWKQVNYEWCNTLITHFRPEVGSVLEKVIKSDSDLKSYFTCRLDDMASDLLLREGWDLTKCNKLI